jgi:DNA-binding NarL/FixJ family response regulator
MTDGPPPRLIIVDDHELAREGLRAVLEANGFDVVACAADGAQAVECVVREVPDLVLMDVRLGPGIDGLEATRRLRALGSTARILVLSLHDSPAYVREALAAGASGYVLKDTVIGDLRDAIRRVLAGQAVIPLDLASAALRDERRDLDVAALLTAREIEILRHVADGCTNKEIARLLAISPATVKAHMERIIAKLGVADRTQAAVLAARQLGR